MKRYIVLLLVVFLGLNAAMSQDVRLMQTKIADALNLVPTYDTDRRDQVMQDILALGDEGLDHLCELVVSPGTGDDTNVRFALNGLAMYVGQEGLEKERLQVSQAFLRAIENNAEPGVRSFFLYHLKFFGGKEIVPVVASLISDKELGDKAVQALVGSDNHPAMHALKEALGTVQGDRQIRVIKALGTYKAHCAVEDLTALLDTGDPDVQGAVLTALAEIADPGSASIMVESARKAGFMPDKTGALVSLVTYANGLARSGNLEQGAIRVARLLVQECQGEKNYTYGLAAMNLLVEYLGYNSLEMLLAGMDNERKDYRGAVLEMARQIDDIGALRSWLRKANSFDEPVKAEIIGFLGEMNDQRISRDLMVFTEQEDPGVRKAAVGALVNLLGSEALPFVLEFMEKADQEDLDQARTWMLSICGARQVPSLAVALEEASSGAKTVIIDLLAARQARDQFNLISRYTKDPDPAVSLAAYRALDDVCGNEDLNALLALLGNTNEDEPLLAVQQALVVAARQIEEPKDRATIFIERFQTDQDLQEKILGVLPRIGGEDALNLVAHTFEKGKRKLRDQAFMALVEWSSHEAAPTLFDIVVTGRSAYRSRAYEAYVRQIRSAPVTGEQKLLKIRKIMPFATTAEQKIAGLQALESIKIFPALVFVADYLDDPDCASSAAWVISKIALPPSGTKNGMFGNQVGVILKRSIEKISGPESDYAKENIRNWLAQMPDETGFVSMFNGKDLSGWQGLVENPIARSRMSKQELAEKQQEADDQLPANWVVEEGEIRFIGSGYQNLCSIKEYEDFELWVDWRIDDKGDSGIYLRGTPQVQIWDTSRVDAGAQVGSGGLYNNQTHESKPLKVADNPIRDWNTFYIKMIGEQVTVYLNGELVVDNVTMENYWDRSIPIFPEGPIELQAHGTNLAFRDVFVREIKSQNYNLTAEEQSEGFVALFNGKNLDGWIGNKTDYSVQDGVIIIDPKGGGHGNLYTQKEYDDFAFRFEFKLTPGANNGIGIRTPPEGDAAYVGMEIQVLDNTAPIYANLQPYQYHGSVYGVIPAKRGFLRPVGDWNEEEIRIEGNRIRVTLNGTVIVDGDIEEASRNGTIDHNEHPGLKRKSGHIGFLGHGSVVHFRNIRIKEL